MYAAKVSGLSTCVEFFNTFFALHLVILLFPSAEQLSTNLTATDITVQEAIHGSMLYVFHLDSLRTEEKLNYSNDKVIQDSSLLTEELKLPRPRKILR